MSQRLKVVGEVEAQAGSKLITGDCALHVVSFGICWLSYKYDIRKSRAYIFEDEN